MAYILIKHFVSGHFYLSKYRCKLHQRSLLLLISEERGVLTTATGTDAIRSAVWTIKSAVKRNI